jgi:opacity protein-like surface antigen
MTKNSLLVAFAFTFGAAATLSAQLRPGFSTPGTWVSVYGLMYTGMNGFDDPDTESSWNFSDNTFGAGATLFRQFGQSVLIGADFSFAKPDYEAELTDPVPGTEPETGSATVTTAMLLGRIAYGGASELGFYLTGGIGTIAYKLEHLDDSNRDFALRAGTGLEYRFAPSAAVFLEWGRLWGYHEKEGVSGGRVSHSQLKLGGRLGF